MRLVIAAAATAAAADTATAAAGSPSFFFTPAARGPVPANAINITVYHVNPAQYGVAPVNMDTGDALGDAFFDLRSVSTPLECAVITPDNDHDCKNAEVTSPNLVITKLVLEIDRQTGEYGRCNICVNGTDNHGNNNCTNGDYVCSCGDFHHAAPCGAAVGKSDLATRYAGEDCDKSSPLWDCWKTNVAKRTGGTWYSTTKEGWCGNSGTNSCQWRVAHAAKRVNKTCSDRSIYTAAERHAAAAGSTCFHDCGAKTGNAHRNISSPCWIKCFYDAVLGPSGSKPGYDNATAAGMTTAEIREIWQAPFQSEDESLGGCPAMSMYP